MDITAVNAEKTAPMAAAKLIEMHRLLLRVRHTEETLAARYREQEMRTHTHFGAGQEAVAVGVCTARTEGDVVYSHHRSHNHYLACGGSVYGLAAELYGRVDGCSGGRGGSVHLTARDRGFVLSSAILGETAAVAVGSALAFAMDRQPRVAVTFFGDATPEEGVFYESLIYAAVRRLPVLFVCENNLYSTESPMSVRQPLGTDLCDRVRAFDVTAERVDGNDLQAVHRAAATAFEHCRQGRGPVFLECMTYRWREHVGPMFDHEAGRTYRSREEVESWMARCPVKRSTEALIAAGVATAGELAAWSEEIQRDVGEQIERARSAPWPDPQTLFQYA